MKIREAIVIFLVTVLLSPLVNISAGGCNWTVHRGNSARSGAIPAGCELGSDRFSRYWDFDTDKTIHSSPVVYGDNVVFISENRLNCVDTAGKKRWTRSLSGVETDAVPAIWNNRVYVPAWRSIDVFDLFTGRENPAIETSSKVTSVLITPERGLFYSSIYNNKSYITYQKNPLQHKKEWTQQLTGNDVGIPAYAGGRVFVASGEAVFGIDYRTGKIRWKREFSNGIAGNNIAISGDNCLFATNSGELTCLSASTGKTIWTYEIGLTPSTCPAVYGNTVLIGASPKVGENYQSKLQAVSLSSGKSKWTFKCSTGENILSSPITSDLTYFSTNNHGDTTTKGVFYCLNTKNGKLEWSIKNTSGIVSSPAISDGLIYFGDLSGQLTCLGSGANFLGFQLGQTAVSIDSKIISIDVEPVVKHGRTLIPARYVIEPLGGWVIWDDAERKVTSYFAGNKIEFWIGKNKARVDGEMMAIDELNPGVVPIIIDGRTMVPFRFLGESAGCKVKWIPETKEIHLFYQD